MAIDGEQWPLEFGWLCARGIQAGYVRGNVVNVDFASIRPCCRDALFILLWHDSDTIDTAVMANGSAFQDGVIVNSISILIVRL
jgi:hypothetical protein